MKQILLTIVWLGASCLIGFSQTPDQRAERVPGSGPVIMSGADFDKLEYAASMDRFGIVSEKEIKPRLDMFVGLLSKGNETVEYAVLLKGSTIKDAGLRIESIYKYLVDKKKISSSRISFALTTTGVNETELWLIPNKSILIPSCPDCTVIGADDDVKLKEFFELKKTN